MKFTHQNFTCAVDIYHNGNDLTVRFYDPAQEPTAEQIINFVAVHPGYGVLTLKFKGPNGLLSGFLDETIFSSAERVSAAIEFVESCSSLSAQAFIPHTIYRVKVTSRIEYNGEY